jgi:hypothetical protein
MESSLCQITSTGNCTRGGTILQGASSLVDNEPGMCYSQHRLSCDNDGWKEVAMIDAVRVTWQGIKDLWEEFVLLIMINIVWSLSALLATAPLLLLGKSNLVVGLTLSFVLLGLLTIVTGALCFVANQVTRGYAISWQTFAHGLKHYWLKSLIVAGISLVALVLIATNVLFYTLQLQGTWTNFAASLWAVLGIYWLIVQIYWFPMLLELESERVFLSLRNALALPFITPGFSVTILAVLIILAILCTFLAVPLPLFMAALLLLIANRATRSRLEMIKQKHERRRGDGTGKA